MSVLRRACREFERQVESTEARPAKSDLVRQTVLAQLEQFTLGDLATQLRMKTKVGKMVTGSENWLCLHIGDGAGNLLTRPISPGVAASNNSFSCAVFFIPLLTKTLFSVNLVF